MSVGASVFSPPLITVHLPSPARKIEAVTGTGMRIIELDHLPHRLAV